MQKNIYFLILFFLIEFSAYTQTPGILDSSFNSTGIVTTAFGPGEDKAYTVAVDANDKIVVAGQTLNGGKYDFAIARYNEDGSLDESFGDDGRVTTVISENGNYIEGLLILEDGKILVSGYIYDGAQFKIALARYNSDGSLDNTFNTDGKLILELGPGDTFAHDMKLQPDGKIVLAGSIFNGSDNDVLVVRLNADGSEDETFNSAGYVSIAVGESNDAAFELAIQPDGKIICAGYIIVEGPDILIMRLNTDGTLDDSFGEEGISLTSWDDIDQDNGVAYTLALQPDGKILLGGNVHSLLADIQYVVIARYTAEGEPDNSFNDDGLLITGYFVVTSGDIVETILDLLVQPDGKIVAAVTSSFGLLTDFVLLRADANGETDDDFGVFGFIATDINEYDDLAEALSLQSDGKLIVAGYASNGSDNDFAVARYFTGIDTSAADTTIVDTTTTDTTLLVESIGNRGMTVFPNPANDLLRIVFSAYPLQGNIIITDAAGRVLLNQFISEKELSINISGLQNGFYNAAMVQNGNLLYRKVFIKQ